MKTKLSLKVRKLASSLLVVLVICGILSLGVAGYLSLVEQQSVLSARSQAWNVAIAIVEAGLEEGLEQLNTSFNNLISNGWTRYGWGSNVYYRWRTLADGNSCLVTLDISSRISPTVTAYAKVGLPALAQNTSSSCFAALGVTQGNPAYVARAVRVRCSKGDLFTCALVAKHGIDLNGNGVYTDSYDSSDTNKSFNCRYNISKYSGDFGDIASNGGITDSVSVQNANIYGTVHTGPGQPVSIGSGGGVGPHGSQVGDINLAMEKGYILQDANFTFPDTTLPSTSGLFQPPSGDVVTPIHSFGTNAVTSATYPVPTPDGGVATNQTLITDSSVPSPKPAGLVTNTAYDTVSSLPSPVPAGTFTNILTTNVTTAAYPVAGTYVGGVTTNPGKHKDDPNTYSYNLITGYTYTYPTYTYTYSSCSYTYSLLATNVTYTTNYYDNIVYGNTTNVSSSLLGSTFIAGPNACLIMPNGLTGSETFTIAQGANVKVYSGGTSVTVSGNQVLNPNGFAGSFIVFCAPTVTSFTLNGNGEFTGVLVAPNADLALNGAGTSDQDFCGSLMVNSARLNGHFRFHWDEALGRLGGNGRFMITSWDEISGF